jgi:hypothetical protein
MRVRRTAAAFVVTLDSDEELAMVILGLADRAVLVTSDGEAAKYHAMWQRLYQLEPLNPAPAAPELPRPPWAGYPPLTPYQESFVRRAFQQAGRDSKNAGELEPSLDPLGGGWRPKQYAPGLDAGTLIGGEGGEDQ